MAKYKNSVIWLKDWNLLVDSLTDEDKVYFWSELFSKYDYDNPIICERQTVLPTWLFISTQLNNMNAKYESSVVERNRKNGSKGGRPKKVETQENPKNPMGKTETQKTLNENKNVNKNNNKKDSFVIFWEHYHKITQLPKTNRAEAEKFWSRMKYDNQLKAYSSVLGYYESIKDKQFISKCRTYIKNELFNDEFKKPISQLTAQERLEEKRKNADKF